MQWNQVLGLAVERVNRFCVFVSNSLDYKNLDEENLWQFLQEQVKAKYPENYWDYLSGTIGDGLFVFDSEQEAWRFYEIFESMPFYSSAFYAQIIAPNGTAITENT